MGFRGDKRMFDHRFDQQDMLILKKIQKINRRMSTTLFILLVVFLIQLGTLLPAFAQKNANQVEAAAYQKVMMTKDVRYSMLESNTKQQTQELYKANCKHWCNMKLLISGHF
jgi:hypothetical protein